MKNALLSFSSALVLPLVLALPPPANAIARPDPPVVATATQTALATPADRSNLTPLQPAAAPVEQQRAEAAAAAAAEGTEPGWRERLALLGAAVLALLFILRREFAQRPGESPDDRRDHTAPRRASRARLEPTGGAPSRAGFMLSEFDNLPADIEPPTVATQKAPDHSGPARKPRHTLPRKPAPARRKARWPGRARPPEA